MAEQSKSKAPTQTILHANVAWIEENVEISGTKPSARFSYVLAQLAFWLV